MHATITDVFNLSKSEEQLFKRLHSPAKIQDFLETLPINFEEDGETCRSPREVLKKKKAHCAEGALFAAAVLAYHDQPALLMDLKVSPNNHKDFDHVVALFKRHGRWGAISKTNHAVLRYREPVYKTVRELAMSYFHEYFLDNGNKTLRSFSRPFNLAKYNKKNWVTSEHDLYYIIEALDDSPHEQILTKKMATELRKADRVEIEAGKITTWKQGRH